LARAGSLPLGLQAVERRIVAPTVPRRRRPRRGRRLPGPVHDEGSRGGRNALVAVVVLAIVVGALLVNSCESNAHKSALKDYNNSVASLNAQSVSTGTSFFHSMSGPTNNPTGLQNNLSQSATDAANELSK